MKEVIYNRAKINKVDINRVIRRSKALIENDNNEFLLANSYNTYYFPGGHVEDDETYENGLIREIKEETGIELLEKIENPIVKITYITKDYPVEGINTEYIANYYYIKTNEQPKDMLIDLTSEEAMGNFKLEFINKKDILKILEENLNVCSNKDAVYDTIEVIREYFRNESN